MCIRDSSYSLDVILDDLIKLYSEDCNMPPGKFLICIQWNLHNTDTIGTLPNCPYCRGVLSSEVDVVQQATPLNQRGSLKLPKLTKKGFKEV